jgi:hypothetical protein
LSKLKAKSAIVAGTIPRLWVKLSSIPPFVNGVGRRWRVNGDLSFIICHLSFVIRLIKKFSPSQLALPYLGLAA